MLPQDHRALWRVIRRHEKHWENLFFWRNSGRLEWLLSIRDVLTQAEDLHSLSLPNLKLQITYILFILGKYASPESSFLLKHQRSYPPNQPFGVRASIALICNAFKGIHAAQIQGYQFREIWKRDDDFFSTMTSRLQHSPLFPAEIPAHELQSIILSLQGAFRQEDIRVGLKMPQSIRIGNVLHRVKYYRRAFLSLNPMLLPKIFTAVMETEQIAGIGFDDMIDDLTEAFHESYSIESLEAAFKKVPEILRSKSDRIVVIEMFHVKAFQQQCGLGYIGECPVLYTGENL